MRKKIAIVVLIVILIGGGASGWYLWQSVEKSKNLDISKYSYPDFSQEGWTETMNVDFTAISDMEQLNSAGWYPSKHGLRNEEYWCPSMIEIRRGEAVVINSEKFSEHVCESGICPESGIFTGGIETRRELSDGAQENVFAQAFGYFEAEVQVPTGTGMWSAFWLQSDDTDRIGDKGKDGSEIDIFESSFRENPYSTGHAVHYDAYRWPWYQSHGSVSTVSDNLYVGYHTYGLLWTPSEYVFFIDGKPVWATAFGGVSRTQEILRLTVEIRTGGIGPYSQNIGQFENRDDGSNEFKIKSVKVYQHETYKSEIKTYKSTWIHDLLAKIGI